MKIPIYFSVFVFSLLACSKKNEQGTPVGFRLTETLSKGKELANARKEIVNTELSLNGKVTMDEDKVARVFPLAGGFVRDLYVELGDFVKKGQSSTLEFVLLDHPLDCPICDRGGECKLQDYTYDHGPSRSRMTDDKELLLKHQPVQIKTVSKSMPCESASLRRDYCFVSARAMPNKKQDRICA